MKVRDDKLTIVILGGQEDNVLEEIGIPMGYLALSCYSPLILQLPLSSLKQSARSTRRYWMYPL